MTDALCQSLNALAYETWVHMDYGFNRGYGRPDERYFTDHHMIELARLHEAEVKTVKIDQNREAQTGADFEWWLGDGASYLSMRVQAKKLDLHTGRYEGLARADRATGKRQVDVLITTSRAERFLPLYLLYNGPVRSSWPADRCESGQISQELRGCTVSLASNIRDCIDQSRIDVGAIAPQSWPWQCLCCCPLSDAPHPGQRALNRFGALPDEPGAVLKDELPDYIRLVRNQDFPRGIPANELDPAQLPGSATVVVMTSRASQPSQQPSR